MLPVWLAWPTVDIGCALLRGAATGFRPYPFLDESNLGWSTVLPPLPVLPVAFAAIGLR